MLSHHSAWPRRLPAALLAGWLSLCLVLSGVVSQSEAANPAGTTEFIRWRAATGGFFSWSLAGVQRDRAGRLTLRPGSSTGEATSPVLPIAEGFDEAIPSWNAETPAGTWIEVLLRAEVAGRWTDWYHLGEWSSATPDHRRSRRSQADWAGRVATDTLELEQPAAGVQVRLRLHGAGDSPVVRGVAVALSGPSVDAAQPTAGDPSYWGTELDVPNCSQMVYPDGGRVWCSPTSTAMVLGYWQGGLAACEPSVRATVAGVADPTYRGYGNWPFNTAYAAALGYDAYVARFESLADLEPWIAAGVPVILSVAWGPGELANAPIAETDGHLLVLSGFTDQGDPIVNDPAAPDDAGVRRVYSRAQLEHFWLEHSRGTVYVIYPADHPVPTL